MSTLRKATHEGELVIGDFTISCAVLEDGTRVISRKSVQKALGRANPSAQRSGVGKLPVFLSATNLSPFVKAKFTESSLAAIVYTPTNGGPQNHGVRADMLFDICEIWLEARDAGVLFKNQIGIAQKAEILMRAFAKIGINALIDEATGYQDFRPKDDLRKILEAYISTEMLPYGKKFPPEFYSGIRRLYGWKAKRLPRACGLVTNALVYRKLPDGVLEILKSLTPRNSNGHLEHKMHQHLTTEIGVKHLENQIASVVTLMKASKDKRQFLQMFRKVFVR